VNAVSQVLNAVAYPELVGGTEFLARSSWFLPFEISWLLSWLPTFEQGKQLAEAVIVLD